MRRFLVEKRGGKIINKISSSENTLAPKNSGKLPEKWKT